MAIKRFLVLFSSASLLACSQSDEVVPSDQSVNQNAQATSAVTEVNPSFDCAKATTAVEKLICSDVTLSKLDYDLNILYREKKKDLAGFAADGLVNTQKIWISRRNNCSDISCLRASYEGRISEIRSDFSDVSIDEMGRDADELARYRGEQNSSGSFNSDPFPYTAVLTCGMGGFDNINLLACLGGDIGTEIEITNGGNYGMYKVYNLPDDWIYTQRGVEIRLASKYSITMKNSHEDLIMGLRIFDGNNNIVFQKEASYLRVISAKN